MIDTPRPSEERNAAEQSEEDNARAEADAQTEEQAEAQAAPTLGDIGSLKD